MYPSRNERPPTLDRPPGQARQVVEPVLPSMQVVPHAAHPIPPVQSLEEPTTHIAVEPQPSEAPPALDDSLESPPQPTVLSYTTPDYIVSAPDNAGRNPGGGSEQPPEEPSKNEYFTPFHYNRLAFLVTLAAVILILLLSGAWLLLAKDHSASNDAQNSAAPGKYRAGTSLQLKEVPGDQLQVGTAQQLDVNGLLRANDTFVVAPTSQPSSPVAGQIYYDKTTNTLYYYNGQQFVSLTQANGVTSLGGANGTIGLGNGLVMSGGQLSISNTLLQQISSSSSIGSYVASLQGQTGNVTLGAGSGISINGTTISNGGVIGLAAGSPNLTITSDGNGHYTISAASASGITGSGTAGHIAKFDGASSITDSSLTESGTTLTYGGNFIVNAASGFSGNLINLEVNGSSKLTVDQSGDSVQAGTLTVNGTGTSSIAGSLSVGTGLTVTTGGATVTGNSVINGTLSGLTGLTSGGTITFSGLTPGGVVHNNASGVLSTGPVQLGVDTTGNYVAQLGTLTGLTTTGNSGSGSTPTLSVTYGDLAGTAVQGNTTLTVSPGTGLNGGGTVALGAGGTLTLNVQYGSSAGTAVAGNTTLTCPTGTGNLQGGGNVVTLGAGGSCNNITISNSPTFTGTLTVQGSGGIVVGASGVDGTINLLNSSNANVTTIKTAAVGQNQTITIPDSGLASDEVCLVALGNCAGSGGGIVGSGTAGHLSKFNSATSITDSGLVESGSTLTYSGNVVIQGSNSLSLGTSNANTGALTFNNSSNANTLTLQAGATGGNLTLTLPTAYGNDGDCLMTNSLGVLSFQACTGGAGGGVTSLDGQIGIVTLANSSGAGGVVTINNAKADASTKGIAAFNATNFNDNGSGIINTIQDISTTSTPTFGGLTLSAPLAVASGGTGANNFTLNGILYGNGTSPIQATSAAADSVLATDSSNVPHLVQTLPMAVQGNITQTGALSSGSITSGFGNISTGNLISTTASLHGGTLSAGASNQFQVDASGNATTIGTLAVQGAGGITVGVAGTTPGVINLANGTNSNLSILQAAAPTGTGNATYNLPSIAGGTSDDICLKSLGNCSSGGTIGGGGTLNHIAKFSPDGTHIADSNLVEAGTTLTYSGNLVVNAGTGFTGNLINLEVNGSSKLSVDQNGNTIQAGTLSVNGTGASSIAGTLSVGTLGTNGTTSLCSNAGVISSCASTGTQGFWTRTGTTLQPANAGDDVTTSGNISTSGTGGITSAGNFVANGTALFKNSADSPTAFQVQNSGGSNLIVADTANSKVGINTGALALNTNLNVYNGQPSTTQTDFTQNLSRAGINFMTDYVQDAYTGGIFWSTQNNNASSPKAGIYTQETNSGSKLLFGTSGSYSAGLTNTALTLGYNGEAIFRNGFNTPTGFQIQNAIGTGLFTVDTTTGATLTSSLFVDTLGTGGTTAVCWNGSLQISSCASTGSIGFWNRTGTDLQPANAGDNIATTGTGTITSAGLLTGNAGLTVTGGAANINASGTGAVTIGNASSGAVAVQSGSTIAITAGTSLNLTSTGSNAIGINPGGGSNTGVVVRPATDTTNLFQIQNAATGASLLNVDSVNSNITLLGNASGALEPWQTATNSLPATQYASTSAVANGYIYEMGGFNGGVLSTVYYAKLNSDGSVGTWTTATNALPAGRQTATSVVYNGYVYVIGGANGSAQSTVYYAKLNSDGSVGTWQTASNALPDIRSNASSVVSNGYVYVIGGSNGSAQSTVYYAKLNSDGSVGTWQTASNALPATRSGLTSAVANGYVYAIGGTNGTYQSTVYYAKLNSDGSVGTWQTATNALPAARNAATSVVANGYVYEIGGYSSGITAQSTVYYAKLNSDGSVGTWSTGANALPDTRAGATSVVANGYVYEIGGTNGANRSTVYYASMPRVQVGGTLDLLGLQGADGTDDGSQGLGSVGGNLIAGDTNIVGTLQVQGAANFSQSVAINGTLNVGSDVTITNTSAKAFQVQDASNNSVLNVDTTNKRVQIGSAGTPTSQLFVSGSAPAAATGSVTPSAPNGLQDIATQGNYAYTIDYSGSLFKVVDISNPASPASIGSVATSSRPQTMAVAGRYAYVGEDTAHKLEIFDISNPTSPSLTGSLDVTSGVLSIVVSGKYAYVGAGSTIKVVDISNPAAPSLVSSFSVSTPLSMFISGRYLYTVDNGATGTFRVIDISNPASLSTVGSVSTGGQSSCSSGSILGSDNIYVSGRYAYVTVCSTNTVKIFDVSNPASPAAVGSGISTGSSTGPIAINVQGRYAYVALYSGNQFGIFDVSNPASPSLIGITSTGASSGPLSLTVQGRYAYVADWLDSGGGKINIYDLGGSYIQQLEAGGTQTGTLAVGGNSTFAGDLNAAGSLQVGQNAEIDGNLGVGGQALFKNSANSSTAFQIQNSSGLGLFTADTSGMNIIMQSGYNGATSAWASTVATNLPAREGNSSVIANGYIYMFGGYNGGGQADVYYTKVNANGSTNSWTATTSLPGVADGNRAVFSNGYIYVFSGSSTQNVYYAKPNVDGTISSWTTLSGVLPAAQKNTAGVAANNGYIYWIGGSNGSSTTGVTYAKQNPDGSLGTFTSTASLPLTRDGVQAVIANGYIYIFGGYDSSGNAQKNVYRSQIASNGTLGTWSDINNDMPANRQQYAAAFVNGYVYIMGGMQANSINGTAVNTVFYAHINADGSMGSWTTSANTLPDKLRWVYADSANGYIYTVDGDNGSGAGSSPVSAVYYTSVSRVQVAGSLDLVGINGGNLADSGGNTGSAGGSLTAGDTNIVGALQVQGMASFAQGVNIFGNLTVGGTVAIKTATNSTTAFQIQNSGGTALLTADTTTNTLTVSTLVVSGNLTVNGHIITGGSTPTRTVGATNTTTGGTGATCTVAGTDTSGVITFVAGTGTTISTTGTLCTITFSNAFGATPRVVLGAGDTNGAKSDPYVTSVGTGSFAVANSFNLTQGQTYTFFYIATQ